MYLMILGSGAPKSTGKRFKVGIATAEINGVRRKGWNNEIIEGELVLESPGR
jgi:hypothetical protein